MPSYRCPYCKHDLGATVQPRCPACGRVMGVPAPLRPPTPPAHREARERLQREAEQQRRALGLRGVPTRGQHPLKPLVIIAIMAVIGGFVLFGVWRAPRMDMQANKNRRAEFELNALRAAVEVFQRECGRYPTTREGLYVLVSRPDLEGWDGPYVNLVGADPWLQPYAYQLLDDGTVDIRSCGPDGVAHSADDIVPGDWKYQLE